MIQLPGVELYLEVVEVRVCDAVDEPEERQGHGEDGQVAEAGGGAQEGGAGAGARGAQHGSVGLGGPEEGRGSRDHAGERRRRKGTKVIGTSHTR